MAKLILSLLILVLFVSCNSECNTQSGATKQKQDSTTNTASCPAEPEPVPEPVPEPEVPGDVPNEAMTFETNVKLFKFEANDEDKLYKALEIIKTVVASNEFRNKVINFTYKGEKKYVDNKGMTNEQIYQAVLDGKEDLLPVVDNEMDLELELYYSWSSTVGYTTPGALRIFMNTKYFDPYTPAEVAGNVFHEWTHKLGFDHAQRYSVERDSSVPYALGYIMRDLGRQYE